MQASPAIEGEPEAAVGGTGPGDSRDNLTYQEHLPNTSCIKVSTAVCGGRGSRIRELGLEAALPLAHRGTPILKMKRLNSGTELTSPGTPLEVGLIGARTWHQHCSGPQCPPQHDRCAAGWWETPLQNRGQRLLCWDPISICQDAPGCLLVASFLGGWLSSTTESVREKCPL